jgi:2-polyprenyl-6-methoxyphenol hydroxylase-like FAD-dependent oxidoreductase
MHEALAKAPPRLLHHKKIAIVGAGPAGLMLARLLQMHAADVTVFERDLSKSVRGQGGSLDLHEDSGQLALQRGGLIEPFQALARPEGQLSRIYDRQGVLCAELRAEDEAQKRPEIDRGDLRNLLLDSLVPGTVIWNRDLVRIDRSSAGMHRLVFENAPPVETDLVFGCDGGWSKVRRLRTDVTASYSGVTFVQTWISDADRRTPDIARFVGPGSLMALGDDQALMAQRNSNGHIRIYIALRVTETWHRDCNITESDPNAVRDFFLKLFDGWAERLLDLLRVSDPVFQPWPLFSVPARQSWSPIPDVTLLGDAAHIMPPFTGRGANYAMLDAVELAERLVAADRFLDVGEALADYEAAMLARMAPAIEETLAAQDWLIAAKAPENIKTTIERQVRH